MGKDSTKEEGAAPTEPPYPFFAKSKEECFAKLGCSHDLEKSGLTSADAAARLEKYGPNMLTEKEKKTIWERIWNQIANVLVLILLIVALVSLVRCFTVTGVDNIVSNALQVGLIIFVITYVLSLTLHTVVARRIP
jgi:Ca2+-transporting ATPase